MAVRIRVDAGPWSTPPTPNVLGLEGHAEARMGCEHPVPEAIKEGYFNKESLVTGRGR